jgi:hypothetical protein
MYRKRNKASWLRRSSICILYNGTGCPKHGAQPFISDFCSNYCHRTGCLVTYSRPQYSTSGLSKLISHSSVAMACGFASSYSLDVASEPVSIGMHTNYAAVVDCQ